MVIQKLLHCPVCDEPFGRLVKNEVCSFVCRECKFVFTWSRDGKLMPPVQLDEKKPKACTCASCKARDYK